MSDQQFRLGVARCGSCWSSVITYAAVLRERVVAAEAAATAGPSGTQRAAAREVDGIAGGLQSFLAERCGDRRCARADASTRWRASSRIASMKRATCSSSASRRSRSRGCASRVERDGRSRRARDREHARSRRRATTSSSTPSAEHQRVQRPRAPLPFNAMVIAQGRDRDAAPSACGATACRSSSRRSRPSRSRRCRPGTSSQVPPRARRASRSGSRAAIAASDQARNARRRCPKWSEAASNRGDIGWRDLVDFYARHRCQTYQFPSSYRAFKSDGERPIPAVESGDVDEFSRR